MAFMYILKCSDNSYYVGSTKDLTKRVLQHKNGEGSEYTKRRLPVELVYFEECQSIETAFLREKQVQGWSRKKREALINHEFEKLETLSKKVVSTGSTTANSENLVVSTGSTTENNENPVVEFIEITRMEKKMYKIQTLNKISSTGLNNFSRDDYEVASEMNNPDAILVRSADMHEMALSDSVLAVARAGAGTNNIPIPALTDKGVVVFNTPGANANAVKELVILAILLSSRPVINANAWAKTLSGKGDEIADLAEKGKSQFVGPEVKGKTLGVIGLGAIGAMVANLAIKMGMNVVGYDPFLSVKAAWELDHKVQHAETLDTVYAKSDYITIHVPQTNDTKGMINASSIKTMKDGVRIINIARGGLVNNKDILEALDSGKVSCMVTDFCADELLNHPKVICMPHLGASTPEAEDNCAIMAVTQLKDFLESGNIVNSVNYPKTVTENPIPAGGTRLCIFHKNVPDVISKFTTMLGESKLNIAGMINQARGEVAYNMTDVNGDVPEELLAKLNALDTVIRVRAIKG